MEKATLFLRKKGINHDFKLKGSDFDGSLLELLREYESTEVVKNITYKPVLATGRKTRADRRNKKAEAVCREARYQIVKYGGIADNNKLSDLILEWLKYGRKICYKRP